MMKEEDLKDFVIRIGRGLRRSEAQMGPYLKTLTDNWYEAPSNLASATAIELSSLGIPLRLARELIAAAAENSSSENRSKSSVHHGTKRASSYDSSATGDTATDKSDLEAADYRRTSTAEGETMKEDTEAMRRLQNVGTYLANERTLLAWTRTALAFCRTTVAVMSLEAVTTGFWLSSHCATIAFAILAVLFLLVGFERFRRHRYHLDRNTVPLDLLRMRGRCLWRWFNPVGEFDVLLLTLLVLGTVSTAVSLHYWTN